MPSQLGLLLLIVATVSLAAAVRSYKNQDFDGQERLGKGERFGPSFSLKGPDSQRKAAQIGKEDYEEGFQGFFDEEDEKECPSHIYVEWTRQEMDQLANDVDAQMKMLEDQMKMMDAAHGKPRRENIPIGILSGVVLVVVFAYVLLSYEVKALKETEDAVSYEINALRECMARDFRTLEGRLQRSEEWMIGELEVMAAQLPELADVIARERTLKDTLQKSACEVNIRKTPSGTPEAIVSAPSHVTGGQDMEIALSVEVLMDKEKQHSRSNHGSAPDVTPE